MTLRVSIVISPASITCTAQRLAAVPNSWRWAREQKRCSLPPVVRIRNGRLHHRHLGWISVTGLSARLGNQGYSGVVANEIGARIIDRHRNTALAQNPRQDAVNFVIDRPPR